MKGRHGGDYLVASHDNCYTEMLKQNQYSILSRLMQLPNSTHRVEEINDKINCYSL